MRRYQMPLRCSIMWFVWSSKVEVEHTKINCSFFLLLKLSNRTCVRKHCKTGMLCSIGCLLKFSAATGAPAFTVHLEYCDSKLSPSSIIPSHFHCPHYTTDLLLVYLLRRNLDAWSIKHTQNHLILSTRTLPAITPPWQHTIPHCRILWCNVEIAC